MINYFQSNLVRKIKENYIAGVDIGGTWVRVALCTIDLKESNIKTKKIRTLKENKFSIGNSIRTTISELLAENHIKKERLVGIGIASAGPLNVVTGVIFNNANLGFRVIPLKEPIEEKFPEIPLFFVNDGTGAVLGVHYFEAGEKEKENLVYITLSTGIGGGAICDGHLLMGKEGNAVEIGHGIVEPKSSIKCNCGAYGCWEVYSSGTGVRLRAIEALNEGSLNSDKLRKIVLDDRSKITAKEVFKAASKGDEMSKKIVDDCIFYTKVGVGLVNNFYDCASIYFGGSMMKDRDQILPQIIEQFEKEPFNFTINHPPKIKLTKYIDEIGLRGALVYIKYKLEGNPVVS
ncbi:MAG TPA: ROK family protein [bacterium]|nr:ROK family protein [archaeon]HEC40941.1 ROK family protein [bacterium]